jgi:hypothetical protein
MPMDIGRFRLKGKLFILRTKIKSPRMKNKDLQIGMPSMNEIVGLDITGFIVLSLFF